MSKRTCRARSARGTRPCKAPAMIGGYVCVKHGGAAPQVKRKAAQRVRDMLADAIDPDRVLREVGRLAYSDITRLFDDNGRLLPMSQWPEDARRAVAGVEVVKRNVTTGDGKIDDVLKIRMHQKGERLADLMKHHGQLTEKVEISGSVDVVERLAEARKRLNEGSRGQR